MAKIPHFAGRQSLSLTDLQALADAVPQPGHTFTSLPGARGRVQYGPAQFNTAEMVECDGITAAENEEGMIASVSYAATDIPYINEGNMVLPLAHDYDPTDDSSEPTEVATGGVNRISAWKKLRRAQIYRGEICLPLAQTAWPQTAEGAMFTPGLVYGVQLDSEKTDECGGLIGYIDQGVIHLPPLTGGGEPGDDDCPATCITQVTYDDIEEPTVDGGVITLPHSIRMLGEDTGNGDFRAYHRIGDLIDCQDFPINMSTCTLPDGTPLTLQAWTGCHGKALCLKLVCGASYGYSY